MIASVTPLPQAQLDDALAQLGRDRGYSPPSWHAARCRVHVQARAGAGRGLFVSFLKSRRQELHAKIASVIDQRFPNIKSTEPEVLAHHLTVAGLSEAAIPLWQTAGERALKRMALTEAISHLSQGLELVSTLPPSSERDASELELRTRLGTAWVALKSWPAPEVWTSLHPALALAKSLARCDTLALIFSGLFQNVLTQGRVAEVPAPGRRRCWTSRRAPAIPTC